MRSRKWILAISVLVIASTLLSACAPTPTTSQGTGPTQPPIKQTVIVTSPPGVQTVVVTAQPSVPTAAPGMPVLRVNTGTYPDLIDPQKSSFNNEIGHLNLIYEGLTRLDPKLATAPGAAEKWEFNADATELTFTIRKDLKYSDGTLVNAKRFEFAILRNIDPSTAGEYAAVTDEIVGAAEWRSADLTTTSEEDLAKLKAAVEVRALDAAGQPCTGYDQADCLTLRVKTRIPAPYYPTVMGLWVTYPVKEENIVNGGDNWWNSSVYQIGNGPFVLTSLEPFVRATFVPNQNYWRGQPTYNIQFSYITDASVAFEAYKNNEFDVVGFGAEDLAQIDASADLKAQALNYPGACTFAIMFHQLKEPFTDKKVREAFAMALDREAYARDVQGGLSLPTLTWIPLGYPGYKEGETRWSFDPAKAVQALNESTYGGAAGLPEVKITYADTARGRTRMEWLAAQWQAVLGVSVVLDPVESTTYTAMTKDINTAPLVYLLGWCADYPDPQNWLSVYWKTGGFGQRIGYSNPELDRIIEQADKELDPVTRMNLYQQAQDMLVDDCPVAFMYNNSNLFMLKPWVKGAQPAPQEHQFPGSVDPLTITIDASQILK